MTSAAIHDLVVGTGRLSAALFVAALLGAGAGYRAVPLWLAFVAAHTVHFSFVAWLAAASDGANLRDIGGWPTALGVGAGFYILVACTAVTWSGIGWRAIHGIGPAGVVLIALALIATYVPLLATSMLFALPVVAIIGALSVYLARVIWWSSGSLP